MAINQQDENQIYPIHAMNYPWLAVYRMGFSKAPFIVKVKALGKKKKKKKDKHHKYTKPVWDQKTWPFL